MGTVSSPGQDCVDGVGGLAELWLRADLPPPKGRKPGVEPKPLTRPWGVTSSVWARVPEMAQAPAGGLPLGGSLRGAPMLRRVARGVPAGI